MCHGNLYKRNLFLIIKNTRLNKYNSVVNEK